MNRFIKIGEAAQLLGVSIQTLRRWEKSGSLLPDRISDGKTRYYSLDKLLGFSNKEIDLTIGYARVSSHDQKKDLKTQADALTTYCIKHGWSYEIIEDLGSGMNYKKKGLHKLLSLILQRQPSKVWCRTNFYIV